MSKRLRFWLLVLLTIALTIVGLQSGFIVFTP